MTDRPGRRRWSRGKVRGLSWATGAATFVASVGALAAAPHPATAQSEPPPAGREAPRVIERHVVRRVIVIGSPTTSVTSAPAPAVIVPVPAAPQPVAAPPPPPAATSSGGS